MFRPPTLTDVDALVELVIACDLHDLGEPDYDREALLEEWNAPGVDLERDGFVADGAYGLLLGTDARAWVHPDRRGEGLGSALAERLEARARERGVPHLAQHLGARDHAGRAMLERRGYVFSHAYANLAIGPDAVARLPRGDARTMRAGEQQAVHDLIVTAFRDGDRGRVDALSTILDRDPDLGLWFAHDAPDGTLAGALRAELREGRGYIAEVATAAAHRGRGVGGALIGAAARALVERGAADVFLYVRSSNPGALRLYEHLGFQGNWTMEELRLDLTPAR